MRVRLGWAGLDPEAGEFIGYFLPWGEMRWSVRTKTEKHILRWPRF